MKTSFVSAGIIALCVSAVSCDRSIATDHPDELSDLTLSQTAEMISSLPIGIEQMSEVHDAVASSSTNGYDEEYTMRDLFGSPGRGVGSLPSATKAMTYSRPMRDLIREYLKNRPATRAGSLSEDEYIESISSSPVQIYWPYSANWDGESLPVVTFDPGTDSWSNIGYEMVEADDGTRTVREIEVNEAMARKRPVWVINTNEDSSYESLDVIRRDHPDWGQGGGVIVRKPSSSPSTKSGADFRTLVLKEFTMLRYYDSWFRGASEFFVKCGSVQGFTASTEAELKLFQPSVTEFMIVVKRGELGIPKPFNAVMISDWTDQLDSFAFLVTEDDGGTKTSWKVDAMVKIQSKSYGINIDIPYNERDDIVWRGSLSSRFFEKYSGETEHFGGVDIAFELL